MENFGTSTYLYWAACKEVEALYPNTVSKSIWRQDDA